jgi:flagellar motor switch protein FliG
MSNARVNKAAILMLSLGEDQAAEVMKHLGPRTVEAIGQAMAGLQQVSNLEVEDVLNDFLAETSSIASLSGSSEEFLRSVLSKALGDEDASAVLAKILGTDAVAGIDSLKWMDAQSVSELVRSEHPQIIATILAHLERKQASDILAELPERLRNDVLLRVATLDGVQPTALRELNDVLHKMLSGTGSLKKTDLGGVRAAAEILNFTSREKEASVLEALKTFDVGLAQKIIDEMFVFENILEIDDRGIQLLLREVQQDSLVVALKVATEDLRQKIYKNMSQRAAEMLRDDFETRGPVRMSEVEKQQKEILAVVRRLADEGQIVLGSKGEDTFV